jgi:hypothetical protein
MIVTAPERCAEVLHDRADLAGLYAEMTRRVWTTTGVDPVLLELCRLLIAQLHGCRLSQTARRAGPPSRYRRHP